MLKPLTLRKVSEITLEVVATVALIVAVAMNSLNYYPQNLYINLFANVLWLFLGILWRKWSLLIIEVVVILLYIFGLAKYLLA